jgi:ABC-2 type transport system permease protein
MSKAITQQPGGRAGNWQQPEHAGPSVLRTDDPSVARIIGMIGAGVVIFSGMLLLLNRTGRITPFFVGVATLGLAGGVACLLFHAAFDWDVQFRRLYMIFGYAALAVGIFLAVLPYPQQMGDLFWAAFLCLTVGLLFLLAFLRNEEDERLRHTAQNIIGGVGALMAVVGLVGGNIKVEFLTPIGLLLALLGLVYLVAFVGSRGISDDRSYLVGRVIGLVGLVVFLIAFGRAVLPPLFYSWNWLSTQPSDYLVPSGVLFMGLGVLYFLVSAALISDRPAVVMTRRELGAYFYSPIAYIVLFACIVGDALAYIMFTYNLVDSQRVFYEPIVRNFVLQWPTVLLTICVVPVITMRLLSEEKRSGTVEVLLTAPVDEVSVVLSKFLSAFLFFLTTWVPFGLLLIALRVEGGKAFDYRPLLSFFVGLCFTGAGFISMGLFFSSLTRNQIVSGILSLVGMVTLTMVFFLNWLVQELKGETNAWATVLTHISYLDIWKDTLDGKLVPRLLLFFASMTIMWLFMTVKVLEARRWA